MWDFAGGRVRLFFPQRRLCVDAASAPVSGMHAGVRNVISFFTCVDIFLVRVDGRSWHVHRIRCSFLHGHDAAQAQTIQDSRGALELQG
jgi:hypothetical protein